MSHAEAASPRPRIRWDVAVLIALALLGRVVMARQAFAYPAGSMTVDSRDYLLLADSLRFRGEFTTGPDDDFDRVIGYPLFLAAFLSLSRDGISLALVAQQLLLLVSCAALYFGVRTAFGGRAAWAAALWLLASPNSLFWAGTLLSETLASFWLAVGFALAIAALRNSHGLNAAASGLSLGLATLTRPIALYLLPLWTGLVALAGPRPRRTRLRWALVLALAGLLPIGMWMGRNYLVHGQPMVSTVSGRTLRDFQLARVVSEVEGISRDEASALMASKPDPTAFGLEVALGHPGAFLRVTAVGVLRTLLGTEVGTWMKTLGSTYQGSGILGALFRGSIQAIREAIQNLAVGDAGWLSLGLVAWGGMYSLGLYGSVGAGLYRSRGLWRGEKRLPIALALASAAYLILIPLGNGDARFRVPAEPFLAFLAGLAWWTVGPPEATSTPMDRTPTRPSTNANDHDRA